MPLHTHVAPELTMTHHQLSMIMSDWRAEHWETVFYRHYHHEELFRVVERSQLVPEWIIQALFLNDTEKALWWPSIDLGFSVDVGINPLHDLGTAQPFLNSCFFTCVLVPSCCCNKWPQMYWLKTMQIYYLTIPEFRSLNGWLGLFLLEALRENPFPSL